MQTFLTYISYAKSAKALDNDRLNKQITEGFQIKESLAMIDSKGRLLPSIRRKYQREGKRVPGWIHHPAVLMWIGFESSLDAYLACCIKEWKRRGDAQSHHDPFPPTHGW
jgi:hypothetical protein